MFTTAFGGYRSCGIGVAMALPVAGSFVFGAPDASESRSLCVK